MKSLDDASLSPLPCFSEAELHLAFAVFLRDFILPALALALVFAERLLYVPSPQLVLSGIPLGLLPVHLEHECLGGFRVESMLVAHSGHAVDSAVINVHLNKTTAEAVAATQSPRCVRRRCSAARVAVDYGRDLTSPREVVARERASVRLSARPYHVDNISTRRSIHPAGFHCLTFYAPLDLLWVVPCYRCLVQRKHVLAGVVAID